MKILLFILIISNISLASEQDKTSESSWKMINLRTGIGIAPDRLFLASEYGYKKLPWTTSLFGAISPSLTHLSANIYYQPVEFLEINGFVGRSQYYRSWKGTGLIPLTDAEAKNFSISSNESRDSGQSAGMKILGLSTTLFWSTLELMPIRFEGLLRFTGKATNIEVTSDSNIFFDPVMAGPVSRSDWYHTVLFFGAWRINPKETNPSRIGFMYSSDSVASNGVKQTYFSPTYQHQSQNSNLEWILQAPIKIENPYDNRSVGFFIAVTLKPESQN